MKEKQIRRYEWTGKELAELLLADIKTTHPTAVFAGDVRLKINNEVIDISSSLITMEIEETRKPPNVGKY